MPRDVLHEGLKTLATYVARIMKIKKLLQRVRDFCCREHGPTTVEYAVMLMLIVLGLITALQIMGSAAIGSYNATSDSMDDALKAAGSAR